MNVGTDNLIEDSDANRELLQNNDKCDKYDYLAAVVCGVVGGLVDAFLVGAPGDTTLGNWTDSQIDTVVKKFAKQQGWSPKQKNSDNVKSAIGFLESKFGVNYDQRKPSDVGYAFNIAPGTHHMMSLAHSPDIIGLFFSILNQFTSTSTFIANGQLITISTDTFELQGGNFIAKIFCGVANWFGHLMSDVAGSSGAHGRGTGIVMPFYELFGLCKFGSFDVNGEKKDLAELASRAFTEGYDFRFGLAQAIPVIITDLSIRLIWAIRRHFQYGKNIRGCIPNAKHSTLRIMLLVGNGTLCAIDGIDAAIKSGGTALGFFMHLNLVAWFRFVTLALKEVCIRLGLSDALQQQLELFRRINVAITYYLDELEKIDKDAYIKESERCSRFFSYIDGINNEYDMNIALIDCYEVEKISIPWKGDFDTFMSDKNNRLEFK